MNTTAKYKIGITEAGDAGIDLTWAEKMDTVDGAILITKCISPDFYDEVLKSHVCKKVIVHATFTGYGRTVLEPTVPPPYEEYDAINTLVKGGFPKEKLVIRIDPIIPTEKGVEKALAAMEYFMDAGFWRYRVSVIDMYPHVRERFKAAGLPLPFGDNFGASKEQMEMVDTMLLEAQTYWANHGGAASELRIETCAEPSLKIPIQCGCISAYDLSLLGLDTSECDGQGYQRKNCMCYSGKTELLKHKARCAHGCLYCYWR